GREGPPRLTLAPTDAPSRPRAASGASDRRGTPPAPGSGLRPFARAAPLSTHRPSLPSRKPEAAALRTVHARHDGQEEDGRRLGLPQVRRRDGIPPGAGLLGPYRRGRVGIRERPREPGHGPRQAPRRGAGALLPGL